MQVLAMELFTKRIGHGLMVYVSDAVCSLLVFLFSVFSIAKMTGAVCIVSDIQYKACYTYSCGIHSKHTLQNAIKD